jgi:POLQ-like helicase
VEDRKIFNEDTGQPTSIDLVIQGREGTRALYIEAKMVEREFGGCSVFQGGDCDGRNPVNNLNTCYLHFIGRLYWKRLEEHGFLVDLMGSSPICPLALYYQFFREVLFAIQSGGDFVLLYDERNPSFYGNEVEGKRGLMPFLIEFVPDDLRKQVHSITIQKVVEELRRDEGFGWGREFERKYALQSDKASFTNICTSYPSILGEPPVVTT